MVIKLYAVIELSYLITFITGIIFLIMMFRKKNCAKYFVIQELVIAILIIIDLFNTFSSTEDDFMSGLADTGEQIITLGAILIHFIIGLIFIIYYGRSKLKIAWWKLILFIIIILIVAVYIWNGLLVM